MLGDFKPGTLRSITWPNGVLEIHIVQPLEIHKRDQDMESLVHLHIRFTFRNRWKYCGVVEESNEHTLRVRLTVLRRHGHVRSFEHRHITGIIWSPLLIKLN